MIGVSYGRKTGITNVLILGASGRIARWVVDALADRADVTQTLFARHPRKLGATPANATIVEGDVLDRVALEEAVAAQDVVYANSTVTTWTGRRRR